MGNNLHAVARKLRRAINYSGLRPNQITFSTKQFRGAEGKMINLYSLSEAVKNDSGRYFNRELYSTASMLKIVFWLRDEWYRLNDLELPTDQDKWNAERFRLEDEAFAMRRQRNG